MRLQFLLYTLLYLFLAPVVSLANISVTTLFSNSMVLQRDQLVPVWGKGANREQVTVTFNGQTKTATTSNGTWKVVLDSMKAGGPYTMTIKGNNTITITDIYMGEVWQCGGQSNMDTRVSYYPHYSGIQNSYKNPKLRYYTLRQSRANVDGYTTTNVWVKCDNSSAIGGLSCLGFFFGKEIKEKLGDDIAVGLIVTAVGGTRIASWLDPATAAEHPELIQQDPDTPPASMYNAWVAPVEGCAMRGLIWMQGENDRTSGQQVYYEERFEWLIEGWRRAWGAGDFPFYYVQLANGYGAKQTSPGESSSDNVIREAQRLALTFPNTSMVVAIDALGAGDSLHFSNKELIGKRLSLIARARNYGEDTLCYASPMFQSMNIDGDTIRLTFTDIGSGLTTSDGKPPTSFAVAGSDNEWYWATTARIDGKTIILTCRDVSSPKNVRYAYASNPVTNLYNNEGLPASPFTTEGNQLPVPVIRQTAPARQMAPVTAKPFSTGNYGIFLANGQRVNGQTVPDNRLVITATEKVTTKQITTNRAVRSTTGRNP
jgi:sialate O-acetylesterase